MWTKNFWKQSAERAVKSAAQAVIGLYPLDQFDVLQADWKLAGGVALGAAFLSVLFSLVTAGVGQPNDPSAVRDTSIVNGSDPTPGGSTLAR